MRQRLFLPLSRIPGGDGGELHALVHDTDFAYGHDLVRNHGPENILALRLVSTSFSTPCQDSIPHFLIHADTQEIRCSGV